MPFKLSNPKETERKIKELSQTHEGKEAIKAFDLEYEFRNQLREVRQKANKTQAEAAEISGLKQQAVSRLEKGTQDRGANISTLLKYVDAMGYRLAIVKQEQPENIGR